MPGQQTRGGAQPHSPCHLLSRASGGAEGGIASLLQTGLNGCSLSFPSGGFAAKSLLLLFSFGSLDPSAWGRVFISCSPGHSLLSSSDSRQAEQAKEGTWTQRAELAQGQG